MTKTYTKTFPSGLRVTLTGERVQTNCPHESHWLRGVDVLRKVEEIEEDRLDLTLPELVAHLEDRTESGDSAEMLLLMAVDLARRIWVIRQKLARLNFDSMAVIPANIIVARLRHRPTLGRYLDVTG